MHPLSRYHCAMNTSPIESAAWAELALSLIRTRQTVLPKRLREPGPSPDQQRALFLAAAAAPDHGQLRPWRFVVVPPQRRDALALAFGQALRERDPSATDVQVAQAQEKAHRSPFLAVAVARLGDIGPATDPELVVDAYERMVSLGAAVQNMALAAHGMGLGSSLTSGQAMRASSMRALLGLTDGEEAICCVNVGSVDRARPMRLRPDPDQFVTEL